MWLWSLRLQISPSKFCFSVFKVWMSCVASYSRISTTDTFGLLGTLLLKGSQVEKTVSQADTYISDCWQSDRLQDFQFLGISQRVASCKNNMRCQPTMMLCTLVPKAHVKYQGCLFTLWHSKTKVNSWGQQRHSTSKWQTDLSSFSKWTACSLKCYWANYINIMGWSQSNRIFSW